MRAMSAVGVTLPARPCSPRTRSATLCTRASRRLAPLAFCLVVLVVACGDDGAGPGSYSGSGGDTGEPNDSGASTAATTSPGSATSADTTGGFTPDPVACEPRGCVAPVDCCVDVPQGLTCPGDYPLNWECTPSGTCEVGDCVSNYECSHFFTGLECMNIGGRARCVAPCSDLSPCDGAANMPGTECIPSDAPARKYCRQAL